MRLAITGHRPPKVGGYSIPNGVYNAVMRAMDEALVCLCPEIVITGMALGIDQWMAELCVDNGVPFVAAIPFDGFDSKWPRESQEHYRRLLSQAYHIQVVSPGAPYDPRLMQVRNQWMVRQCDKLLAVFNGSTGGTANCVRAARNMQKEVVLANIHPDVWRLAKVTEAELEERSSVRAAEAEVARRSQQEFRRSQQEMRERIAAEGIAARARMAEIHAREEEARQHPMRRGRSRNGVAIYQESADSNISPVPANITEDLVKMREELDRRVLAAITIPADLLDPDRAEKELISQTRQKIQTEEENERLMPRRVIEVD
jgi:uncharacterized phage-like protein YoqJ